MELSTEENPRRPRLATWIIFEVKLEHIAGDTTRFSDHSHLTMHRNHAVQKHVTARCLKLTLLGASCAPNLLTLI